jgi:hypothetical protein
VNAVDSKSTNGGVSAATRDFRRVDEDRYILSLPQFGLRFELDRVRRRFDELVAELTVSCELAGSRVIPPGDINLSSIRARQDWARLLARKSRAREIPWDDLVDELAHGVLRAERAGRPTVLLRDLPRASSDDFLTIDGFPLLRRHPLVLFGDGGAAKSYFGLHVAGCLELQGIRVLYVDWEFAGEDHRDRLQRLFGDRMPPVRYLRCERPLVHEVDHLRRLVKDEGVEYAVLDSIAFACHDKVENADVAAAYFRCLRQLGIGTLNVAHITKGEHSTERPFGSAFWHHGCRSSWFAKRASESANGRDLVVGLFNKKCNVGPLCAPLGFQFRFDADRTVVHGVDLTEVPQLADQLSVSQRMRTLLRTGAKTVTAIADELAVRPNTVTQTAKRGKGKLFTVVLGSDGIQRIGLLAKEDSDA